MEAVVVNLKAVENGLHSGDVGQVRRGLFLLRLTADDAGKLDHTLIHAGHSGGAHKDVIVVQRLLDLRFDLPVCSRRCVCLPEEGAGQAEG